MIKRPIEFELGTRVCGKTSRLLSRAVDFVCETGRTAHIYTQSTRMSKHTKDLMFDNHGIEPSHKQFIYKTISSFGTRMDEASIMQYIRHGDMAFFDDFDYNQIVTPILDHCYYTTSIMHSRNGESKSHRRIIDNLSSIAFIKRIYGPISFDRNQVA